MTQQTAQTSVNTTARRTQTTQAVNGTWTTARATLTTARRTQTTQAVNGTRGGELCSPETGSRIPSPDLVALLEQPQHRIRAREPPCDSLTAGNLAGQNPVAVQQLSGLGVGDLGLRRRRLPQRGDQ